MPTGNVVPTASGKHSGPLLGNNRVKIMYYPGMEQSLDHLGGERIGGAHRRPGTTQKGGLQRADGAEGLGVQIHDRRCWEGV